MKTSYILQLLSFRFRVKNILSGRFNYTFLMNYVNENQHQYVSGVSVPDSPVTPTMSVHK
jgi:hypothetical protein